MDHQHHHEENLKLVSFKATLHCLTGCAIGEVLGMILGAALGLNDIVTIILAVSLAFAFGLSLTMKSLLKAGLDYKKAFKTSLASDTLSITTMEIVDNLFIVLVSGAMTATLTSFLFWWSLTLSLVIAGLFAWPVNYYLIKRGKGHALVHKYH